MENCSVRYKAPSVTTVNDHDRHTHAFTKPEAKGKMREEARKTFHKLARFSLEVINPTINTSNKSRVEKKKAS